MKITYFLLLKKIFFIFINACSFIIYLFFITQETMEDIDKNGDGVIDLEEYIG